MSDKKPRQPRPLGAGEAYDKISALRADRAARRAVHLEQAGLVFDTDEDAAETKIRSKVPEDLLPALDRLLRADDVPPLTASEFDAAVSEIPAGVREPLSEARLRLGGGRK